MVSPCVCVFNLRLDCPLTRSVIEDWELYRTPFSKQLEVFAAHGVMVTPTGAGLANAMFMPPYSSVVEVFPALTDSNLGPILAATSGLGYFPVHTHDASYLYKKSKVQHSCLLRARRFVWLFSSPSPSCRRTFGPPVGN